MITFFISILFWAGALFAIFDPSEPVDVVIPSIEKDLDTLDLAINGIRENGVNIRRIVVVSRARLTDQAEWFDEAFFPFSIKDVAEQLTWKKGVDPTAYLNRGHVGWYYQQLLKLYAPLVIPGLSSNVLILDSDTIFINQVSFVNEEGGGLYAIRDYIHPDFPLHAKRFYPDYRTVFAGISGVSHHMLFQKEPLKRLFKAVEKWSSYYPKAPERIGRELLESPLKITPYFSLKKGLHERVEDCLVCTESDEYYLAAVLDGYRGDSVALMAKERFRTKFLPLIHGAYRGLPFQAFTRFLDILHSEVQDQDAGSMLVASLVEKATGHLFTATLGDPEAYNFQASETSYNVIPKSCKRNWTYPKEAIRAAHFLEKPSIVSEWTCQKDAKEIRFGFSYQSTHISRGIGNRLLSGNRECPGILWKPKITSGQLLAGDFHLLGSHSLYHLLSIGEIVDHVNRFSHCENPAEDLTSLALSRMNDSSSEDIAALFLKVS